MYWVSKFFCSPKHPDQFSGTASQQRALSAESKGPESGAKNAFYFNDKIRMSGDAPSVPLYLHCVYMNKIYLLYSMTISDWGRDSHAVATLQSFLQLLQFLFHCTSHIASVANR
jgi:hypothetical protein